MPNNLTSLANIKAWLGSSNPTDDALLTRLIAQASQSILNYIQRPGIFQRVSSEVYDGTGSGRLVLRNWPVLSVGALRIDTRSISSAASYGQTGFWLEPWDGSVPGRPQSLELFCHRYRPGHGNVLVTYIAGYVVQGETQTVSSDPYQVIADAPNGSWAQDQGVTYADGGALTPVAASPAEGQYAVGGGVYTFAAADQGKSVLLSYSFTPPDLEQACIELAAERYRYKGRIGEKAKTLGGQETTSYLITDMPPAVKMMLDPYRRVFLA